MELCFCVGSLWTPLRRPMGVRSGGRGRRVYMAGREGDKGSESPQVKSSFYKRPSRAIEKGGGFYIPGLRGPRLRIGVGFLVLALLAANHASAGKVLPRNFIISEAIASSSALAVLLTAAWSIWGEKFGGRADTDGIDTPTVTTEVVSADSGIKEGGMRTIEMENLTIEREWDWVSSVLLDLTEASAVAVFKGNELILRAGACDTSGAGEVVQRVAKENRSLFIADSESLPEGIGFPFLTDRRVAAAVHPMLNGEAVLVVAASVEGSNPATFTGKDRLWIQEIATRLDGQLRALKIGSPASS